MARPPARIGRWRLLRGFATINEARAETPPVAQIALPGPVLGTQNPMKAWASTRLQDANQRTEWAIAALRRLRYREYLRSAHWHRVRTLALERAQYQCALCPETSTLDVHHKSYARKGFEQPEDVVVLCRGCHARHHLALKLSRIHATDREPIAAPIAPMSALLFLKRA